jgi:hypothetical protein
MLLIAIREYKFGESKHKEVGKRGDSMAQGFLSQIHKKLIE